MTELEQQLLSALIELETAVKGIRESNAKPDLRAIFDRIDRLAAQLPPSTATDLRHYLQRKSYEKARAWLENRRESIPAGACGR